MKLSFPVFLVSLLANHASANLKAGPYQAVLMFYAYRMDILAFGAKNILFAKGCHGSMPDGTCTFDELTKYLQRAGQGWSGSTSTSTSTTPEVHNTALELAGSNFKQNVDPAKMLPGQFHAGTQLTFFDMFTAVVDNIQACRKEVIRTTGSDGKILYELGEARSALTSVQDSRRADSAQAVIDGVKSVLGPNNSVIEKTVQANTFSGSWQEIDTQATIKANPTVAQAIQQFVTNYNSPHNKNAAGHLRAIQACQALALRLYGDENC